MVTQPIPDQPAQPMAVVASRPDFSKVTPSGRTPLKEFKGKLVSHQSKVVTFGTTSRYDVVFSFVEMQVLQSDTPYLLPIAEIALAYKESENSTYGELGKSYAAALGLKSYLDVNIEATYGKVQHWFRHDNHKYGERKTTVKNAETGQDEVKMEAMLGPRWEVKAVEGVVGVSAEAPLTIALKLADGKNEGDFYRAALQDIGVKSDATLVNQIMEESFIPAMVAIGVISKDDNGVLHVDWEKAPK